MLAVDRGQQLSRPLPAPLRAIALRYSDWNWSWRADIALRYVPVEAALQDAGFLRGTVGDTTTGLSASRVPRILDVGCGSKGGVTSYLPVQTIGVDLAFNIGRIRRHTEVTPIVGNGLALPLRDGSFDVVLCMDTLEHLSATERIGLTTELFRVAADDSLLIVGAPAGAGTRAAEQSVNDLFRERTGEDHPWLAEHLAAEPLETETLRELMASAASRRFKEFDLKLVPNTTLALWQSLQQEGRLRHVHRLLYQPLWTLFRDRHDPPVYRQVCVVNGR